MSEQERKVPGEKLSSRLEARSKRRPRLGFAPAFYARHGLDDPWAPTPAPGEPAASDGGFVYLSGAPFYAMMRRLAQARRRRERRHSEFLEKRAGTRMRAPQRQWPGEAGVKVALPASLSRVEPVLPQSAPARVEPVVEVVNEGGVTVTRPKYVGAKVIKGDAAWGTAGASSPKEERSAFATRPAEPAQRLVDRAPGRPAVAGRGQDVGGVDAAAPMRRRAMANAGSRFARQEEADAEVLAASVAPSRRRRVVKLVQEVAALPEVERRVEVVRQLRRLGASERSLPAADPSFVPPRRTRTLTSSVRASSALSRSPALALASSADTDRAAAVAMGAVASAAPAWVPRPSAFATPGIVPNLPANTRASRGAPVVVPAPLVAARAVAPVARAEAAAAGAAAAPLSGSASSAPARRARPIISPVADDQLVDSAAPYAPRASQAARAPLTARAAARSFGAEVVHGPRALRPAVIREAQVATEARRVDRVARLQERAAVASSTRLRGPSAPTMIGPRASAPVEAPAQPVAEASGVRAPRPSAFAAPVAAPAVRAVGSEPTSVGSQALRSEGLRSPGLRSPTLPTVEDRALARAASPISPILGATLRAAVPAQTSLVPRPVSRLESLVAAPAPRSVRAASVAPAGPTLSLEPVQAPSVATSVAARLAAPEPEPTGRPVASASARLDPPDFGIRTRAATGVPSFGDFALPEHLTRRHVEEEPPARPSAFAEPSRASASAPPPAARVDAGSASPPRAIRRAAPVAEVASMPAALHAAARATQMAPRASSAPAALPAAPSRGTSLLDALRPALERAPLAHLDRLRDALVRHVAIASGTPTSRTAPRMDTSSLLLALAEPRAERSPLAQAALRAELGSAVAAPRPTDAAPARPSLTGPLAWVRPLVPARYDRGEDVTAAETAGAARPLRESARRTAARGATRPVAARASTTRIATPDAPPVDGLRWAAARSTVAETTSYGGAYADGPGPSVDTLAAQPGTRRAASPARRADAGLRPDSARREDAGLPADPVRRTSDPVGETLSLARAGVGTPDRREDAAEAAPRSPSPLSKRLHGLAVGAPAPSQEPAWSSRADGAPRVTSVNGLFESLARAQSAEEVVRVLFLRADGLREAPSEVRAPVQAVIQEIQQEVARTVTTSAPVAAPAEATRPSRLARPETRSLGEAPVRSRPSTTTKPTAAYRGAVTVRSGDDRVMKLVRKLQDLIHLAETQNRLADAQRQVRMAEDSASARTEAGHGAGGNPNSPDKDSQVDVEALVREVSASIGRELQNRRERRTEDPDESVWW